MRNLKLLLLYFIIVTVASIAITGCAKEKASTGKGTENEKVIETAAPSAPAATVTPEVFEELPVEYTDVNLTKVTVHDPSIIKTNGSYYVFGSHMAWAKSDDLMNWTYFYNNINSKYKTIFTPIWEDWCKTPTNPNVEGNLWAPDVIFNKEMNKYCMYMSVNGDDWNSSIVLLTADNIQGPYTYVGPVVYSGFNTSSHPVQATDVYKVLGEEADIGRYQSTLDTKINAIDPCVRYDEEGNLWMSFGSWFGGIYMLRLDSKTGLRDYTYTYTTVENESDQYYGYKLAGGYGVSGEGCYIHKFGEYFYLFLSYGGLTAQGGYQMRVFRSDNIYGPYVDENGLSSVNTQATNNLSLTYGVRIMGSYKFSGNAVTRAAQGHNSVMLDDDGKMYVVFHTRFIKSDTPSNAEAHQVNVYQLFMNEDGWLVAAPYEYSGETISATGYDMKEVVGEYEFVAIHPTLFYQIVGNKEIGINVTKNITLYSDGIVSGDTTGTWKYQEGSANMSITINGVDCKGVFLKQANETDHKLVMTFTAQGSDVCFMGSKK